MIKRTVQSLNHDMPYFSISSLHCLCVAKQAIAHILISTPVWNCFPRMSHTPWLGVATVRFCGNKTTTDIQAKAKAKAYAIYSFKITKQSLPLKLWSLYCTMQLNWLQQSTSVKNHSSKEKQKKKPKPHPSSVLQHWSGEHAPRHMRHLIPDFELELLNKWICIIICTSHLDEEFFVLQKYLIIIHVTNKRPSGMLQKRSTTIPFVIEKDSDLTAQHYQPIPSENN